MPAKNPRPLTQPRKGEPNHGKFCNAPGSLPPESNLPIQPSLAEQMIQATGTGGGGVTTLGGANVVGGGVITIDVPTKILVFDHKACILCDHVIVQKILGNKCGKSGSLCCNLKECPIEARKRRDAEPVKQLTIESYGDGAISIAHDPFETHFNKQEVAEIRAYLNKDVIAELERRKSDTGSFETARVYGKAIALLRGDDK